MPTEAQKGWCAENAQTASELYFSSLTPETSAIDWATAVAEANRLVDAALASSDHLRDVRGALIQSGEHMRVFRHALAPPKSQDQFKILCKEWSKSSEQRPRGVDPSSAEACAAIVTKWIDNSASPWVLERRDPTAQELSNFRSSISALIASQEVSTATRKRLSSIQESQVVALLEAAGWRKLPSKLVDQRADLPTQHFMHKTRFATNTSTPQEVDIACGLPKTIVVAMECKVTNDHTNSVKRINDILKKANAWKAHWGSFVITAAMLQGVIKGKDVERLIDSDVQVFWSHDIDAFGAWLRTRCEEAG